MRLKAWGTMAAAAVAAALLTGCGSETGNDGGSGQQPQSLAEIEAAAKEEGAVTWYTTGPEGPSQEVLNAFREQYPEIEVNLVRQAVVHLAERFLTENQAQDNAADLLTVTDLTVIETLKESGLVDEWVPPAAEEVLEPRFLGPDGYYYMNRLTLTTISINTNLVPEARAPTSYADLLDPWWAGKVGLVDARINGGGYYGYWGITQAVGEEYWEQLSDAGVHMYEQGGQARNALTSGEVAATIAFEYHTWDAQADGAPVSVVYPEEGVGWSSDETLIPSAAPNKNAGKLLSQFLLTDGLEIYAQVTKSPFAPNDAPMYPGPEAGRPPLSELTLLTDLNEAEEDKEALRDYFDSIW